jgi:hypothetical protein
VKKTLLSIIAIAIAHASFAQWTPSGTNIYYNLGKVGIGTMSPNSKLHIAGGGRNGLMIDGSVDGASTSKYLSIWQGIGGVGIDPIGTGLIYLGYDQASDVFFGHSSSGNENGVWKASGKVGIGTTSPSAPLQVQALGSTGSVQLGTWVANPSTGAIYLNNAFANANDYNMLGGAAAPLYLNRSSGLSISFRENNGTDQMTIASGGNVGIGTAAPDAKLTVKGTIHAEQVKVDLNVPGPDYVFDADYKLTGLNELKVYLDKYHHLPEIPSADEMAKNGVDLGEMNIKLLKKVEELTLYLIEKDKQLKDQQNDIQELKKEFLVQKDRRTSTK